MDRIPARSVRPENIHESLLGLSKRDGRLNLERTDPRHPLPLWAVSQEVKNWFGGDGVEATNYYSAEDESISASSDEDIISETGLTNFLVKGISVTGSGDATVKVSATIDGSAQVIFKGTLSDDARTLAIEFPNPIRVDDSGSVALNVANTTESAQTYTGTIFGVTMAD